MLLLQMGQLSMRCPFRKVINTPTLNWCPKQTFICRAIICSSTQEELLLNNCSHVQLDPATVTTCAHVSVWIYQSYNTIIPALQHVAACWCTAQAGAGRPQRLPRPPFVLKPAPLAGPVMHRRPCKLIRPVTVHCFAHNDAHELMIRASVYLLCTKELPKTFQAFCRPFWK